MMHVLNLLIAAACFLLAFLAIGRTRGWRSPARWAVFAVLAAASRTYAPAAARGGTGLLIHHLVGLAALGALYSWAGRREPVAGSTAER
ncbi:hypothetical protein ACGFX4_39420 [Kitasatospora sp. NPDC048365]|uniref:hypothetical protein n=1 Tax=Kitasatospora sp. NPDC048365 TaxID=3364050 RepID=UPI003711B369